MVDYGADEARLLIKSGFVEDVNLGVVEGKTPAELVKYVNDLTDKEALTIAKQEMSEEGPESFVPTEFPEPSKRYRLIWEMYNLSIEESYFWILDFLREYGFKSGTPFSVITKTEDVFAAAETSAFFGVTQQRLGLQQDKVSTFLATIGKMVKELFQLVRELRIIDERLDYYHESLLDDRRKAEAAEITLKGIYIDMVEGGAKNPASVYGMSREVQFTSLPDLFFSTHPKLAQDVDQVVDTDRSDFNKSVRNVLKRKLKTFLVWKKRTFKELVTRRKFTLKYLRQHFDIIKMYMNWVRPYLRHIRRLHFDESKFTSPDLVAAFENSLVDIEFMAHPPLKKINPCIVAHFQFRTRPVMAYQQEGYQRGAQHLGKMQLDLRGYVWSKQEIDNYLELKQAQDFELMKVISASVRAAMEALGDELEQYLKIAGEDEPFTKTVPEGSKLSVKEKLEKPTNLFTSIFTRKGKPKKHVTKLSLKDEKAAGKADKRVKTAIYLLFKDFKKGHQMISW